MVLLSACAVFVIGYFTASKWAIRHETLTFYDRARNNRPVAVDVAVRRDGEMRANAGLIRILHGTPPRDLPVEFSEPIVVVDQPKVR